MDIRPISYAPQNRRRHRSGRQQPQYGKPNESRIGRMNTNKTKVTRNKFASKSPVNVTHKNATTCIEEVNEYVYLGRLLNQNNDTVILLNTL
uniref:Uncharacterized protein n=1 Tax=Caenorhabditis japonica TaxID=281687 RepID=A0A8R1EQV6_CAEJA